MVIDLIGCHDTSWMILYLAGNEHFLNNNHMNDPMNVQKGGRLSMDTLVATLFLVWMAGQVLLKFMYIEE